MDKQTVDGLAWVRERPAQFFSRGRVEVVSLLAYLMSDVLELGGGECRISTRDLWAFVASDIDWLRHERLSTVELFNRVVPAPAHGEHSMRAEVLVNAFATDVFTWAPEDRCSIRGNPPEEEILRAAVDLSWSRRVVAFRTGPPNDASARI